MNTLYLSNQSAISLKLKGVKLAPELVYFVLKKELLNQCQTTPKPIYLTICQVAARLMDRKYERVGREINTSVKLDTDQFNPRYEHRVEFREPNMPPSCTMVAKVSHNVLMTSDP